MKYLAILLHRKIVFDRKGKISMDLANLFSILIILGLVWSAAFFRLKPIIWTLLLGTALILFSTLGYFSFSSLIIFWSLFIIAAVFANLSRFRQRYVVKPALKHLKNQMPTISVTEKTAIEAGDTWWEKELFCGRPKWQQLYKIPCPTLSNEEQQFLRNQVEHLCSMINDWQFVYENQDLSAEVWDYLKKEKFFGMVIPKQYGGLGFSALAHSTVVTKIATTSVSAAVTTMVPNSLGPSELLLHYGTDEQKNYYLPRLASGTEIPCFALTGPDAGSDAGAITDTGIICRGQYQGEEALGIRLSWDKRYITLAPVATVLGLAFHLYDPNKLMGDQEDMGITLCLIPTSHPGVEIGSRHLPMQLAFMNGPTRGKDVFVPLDWIIGGAKMAGEGWRMLMECLSIGRSISLPALATGSGKVAYRLTGAYARVRRQFNVPIASFEGIEEALGHIAGYTYLLEAARIMTAGAVDQKINPAIVSAIAKYHMTELCRHTVSHAMDVHAGHMIQAGPRNFLANIYSAVPISITVEGANILTRNLIIFGQGAIRCHPYLLKEIELISAENTDLIKLDKTLMSHVGYFMSNLIRTLSFSVTGGKFIFANMKSKKIKKWERQLTRMSAALALLSDTSLLLLGGGLKRKERISARLGDILSHLYLASAVLKFFYDHHQPNEEIDYVCWSLQYCLAKIQTAMNELLHNFPNRIIGNLLSWIIFPLGLPYRLPSDHLHNNIVTPMLTTSAVRDRLTQFCYNSNNKEDLGYRLNQALEKINFIDPIWKKLHKAIQTGVIPKHYSFAERIFAAEKAGILNEEEKNLINEFELLRNEIIKVNEFSFDLRTVIA